MKIINFKGLNCYYNSVINIARIIKADYLNMLCGLWQETDFTFDSSLNAYFSKRVATNLKNAGIEIERTNLERIERSEYFLVGIDMIHLKWCLAYNSYNSPHYFIAKMDGNNNLVCFDPTYNKTNALLNYSTVKAHAFDISRIIKTDICSLNNSVIKSDAEDIINNHPQFLNDFVLKIQALNRNEFILAAKYVDALMLNRRLYKLYLQEKINRLDTSGAFSDSFFSKLTQIKNGLYKAASVRENVAVINEICNILEGLIDEEINFAKKVICHTT